MRNTLNGLALLTTLAAIWGSSFLFIKVGLGSVTPLTIAAGRITLAAVVLLIVARLAGYRLPPPGRHWVYIVSAALLGNVLPFSFISMGEQYIDSSLAAILMSSIPLFTIAMAHVITDDERLTIEKAAGVAVGFVGVVLLIGPASLLHLGQQTLAQLLVTTAAVCYALSGILSRHLRDLPKFQTSAAILLVASAFILPAALVLEAPWTLSPEPSAIGAIVVLGILSTATAQLIVLRILQKYDASFLALNNYLVPMFGAFWGILILSERPGPNTGIAFLVVLAGIFICQGGISRSVIAIRRWRTRDKVNTGVL